MAEPPETCWATCREAARGDREERDAFVERYRAPIRAFLRARWPAGALSEAIEDVLREVFDACFEASRGGEPPAELCLRRFLLGLVRAAALRVERFHEREYAERCAPVLTEAELTLRFDLAWAHLSMRETATRQKARAMVRGQEAMRRAELLRLRIRHGLDLTTVARRWSADPAVLVREERLARGEFDAALREVLAFQCAGDRSAADAEREHLLDVLAAGG